MLEYTGAGKGLRLKMLCSTTTLARIRLGPAKGFPTQSRHLHPGLYDEAKKDGWIVISMKKDWKRIFGFDGAP